MSLLVQYWLLRGFFKFSFCYILFWYSCLKGWMWKQCALHIPVTPPLDPCTARLPSRFPTSRPPPRHSAFCRARRLGLSAVMQDPIIKYAIFISPAYAFFHYITEQILIYWNNIFFSFKKKPISRNHMWEQGFTKDCSVRSHFESHHEILQ